MAIKKFQTNAAREAAGYPTDESRVSLIESSNRVYVDGVNSIALTPVCGDAVYHDGSEYKFFKGGDAINHQSLVALGFTRVGEVAAIVGNNALVIKDTATTKKYLDVCQYSITAISSTNIRINLRFLNSAGSDTAVNVALTSAEINATSASQISAAVSAAAAADGDNVPWWAYLADADGNQVASGGTQIIVQRDACDYWQFVYVSGTGCTISLSVWGDMPASDTLRRNNGVTSYYGGMNYTRFYTYYSVNGSTPSADVPLVSADIVKESEFESSTYCALLRTTYGTYEKYLRSQMVRKNQKYGVFTLSSGKELTEKYGNMTAPTKAGGSKYKFPALNDAYNVGFSGIEGIDVGDWFLPGVEEGMIFMDDDVMAAIQATCAKTGATPPNNSSYRWFAERYNAINAWIFDGINGYLSYYSVYSGLLVQAVTLLPFKN